MSRIGWFYPEVISATRPHSAKRSGRCSPSASSTASRASPSSRPKAPPRSMTCGSRPPQVIERGGAFGLDDGEAREAVDEAEGEHLPERFAECGRVAEITSG